MGQVVILSEAPVLSLSKERICFTSRSVIEREILRLRLRMTDSVWC